MSSVKYKRILLKLSGEDLSGKKDFGICSNTIEIMAREVLSVYEQNIQIGIVIGGGNIFRGLSASEATGMDRASCDYMGMLATCINALALQNVFEHHGIDTRVQTAIEMSEIAEPYIRRRALRHLEKGRLVIFAAGTGRPYFTTDTAAALKAMEINADILIKATKVEGLYDKDPLKFKDAKFFEKLSYLEVLEKDLQVIDSTAISLCKDNKLPINVFNLHHKGNLKRILRGESVGTMVSI